LFARALIIEKPWFIEDIQFIPEEKLLKKWYSWATHTQFYKEPKILMI